MAQAILKIVLGALVASTTVVSTTAQIATAQGFTGDFAPDQWELFNSSPAFPDIDNSELTIDDVPLAPFNGSVAFDEPDSLTLLGSNQSGIFDELDDFENLLREELGDETFELTCNTAPSFLLFLCRDSFTFLYVTVPERGEIFFDWEYVTEDSKGPAFDLFGYTLSDFPPEVLPDSPFNQISDSDGEIRQKGSHRVSVDANDFFGFSIGTGDNEGGRARVTITNFGLRIHEPKPISVPEPSSGLAIAALAGLGLRWSQQSKSIN